MSSLYHTKTFRKCKYCDKQAKRNIQNGRNKGFYRTCGSEECLKEQYKDKNVSKKKSHKGKEHPKWIEDRRLLKQKRCNYEEKIFFKKILLEKDFTCELTNKKDRYLSVHHKKPVWKYPDLQFDKNNCIVILKRIHKFFHNKYGFKADENDWEIFIKRKEYVTIS